MQAVPEDFDIKRHVVAILERSDTLGLRPKNMDVDAFLRYVSFTAHLCMLN